MHFQDSIYGRFLNAATIRYEVEATSYLEKATAETRVMEIHNNMRLLRADVRIEEQELRILLNDTTGLLFKPNSLEERALVLDEDSGGLKNNPVLMLAVQKIQIEEASKSTTKSKMMPDLSIGYFNQSMNGNLTKSGEVASSSDRFSGIQAKISIPLFYGSYKGEIQAAKLNMEIAETQANYYDVVLKGQYNQAMQEVFKHKGSLDYYSNKAIPQADLIISSAQLSFENEAIGYVEYFQNMNQGLQIKFIYLRTLNDYNHAIWIWSI